MIRGTLVNTQNNPKIVQVPAVVRLFMWYKMLKQQPQRIEPSEMRFLR
jgi:hypothetical protein